MSGSTKIKTLGKNVGADAVNPLLNYQADTGISYEELKNGRILDKLTADIQSLDKESHEQIYVLLRKHKPEKFFTHESKTLIFDRDSLSEEALKQLYDLVKLCCENQRRDRIIKKAEQEYLGSLDSIVVNNDIAQSLGDYDTDFKYNPSEQQKLTEMLFLNNIN